MHYPSINLNIHPSPLFYPCYVSLLLSFSRHFLTTLKLTIFFITICPPLTFLTSLLPAAPSCLTRPILSSTHLSVSLFFSSCSSRQPSWQQATEVTSRLVWLSPPHRSTRWGRSTSTASRPPPWPRCRVSFIKPWVSKQFHSLSSCLCLFLCTRPVNGTCLYVHLHVSLYVHKPNESVPHFWWSNMIPLEGEKMNKKVGFACLCCLWMLTIFGVSVVAAEEGISISNFTDKPLISP